MKRLREMHRNFADELVDGMEQIFYAILLTSAIVVPIEGPPGSLVPQAGTGGSGVPATINPNLNEYYIIGALPGGMQPQLPVLGAGDMGGTVEIHNPVLDNIRTGSALKDNNGKTQCKTIGGKFMYGINIFDKIKMPLDWALIYYGIKNEILSIDIAQEFACRKLEHDEQMVEEELELSWNSNNRLDVLELIEKILEIQGNVDESIEKAKDKIRIAIIIYLRNAEKDVTKLLEQLNITYTDFDYPVDMENFISYMPNNDENIPANHTFEDNRNYLLSKLDDFIEKKVEEYQLERAM